MAIIEYTKQKESARDGSCIKERHASSWKAKYGDDDGHKGISARKTGLTRYVLIDSESVGLLLLF